MPEPFRTIRVLVVDDHTAVRAGLKTLLDCAPGIRVVAEAKQAAEAVALCASTRPDVVLMDVRLAGRSGIEACRQIKADYPDVQVVMLSAYSDEEAVVGAVIAGASGYLLKQSGTLRLTEAVRTAAAGGSSFDPRPTRVLLSRFRALSANQAEAELQGLTDRERRILALIAEGCTNSAIGAAVHLSEKTVRNLIGQLLQKFGFRGRAHAAAWAGEHGLLSKVLRLGAPLIAGICGARRVVLSDLYTRCLFTGRLTPVRTSRARRGYMDESGVRGATRRR